MAKTDANAVRERLEHLAASGALAGQAEALSGLSQDLGTINGRAKWRGIDLQSMFGIDPRLSDRRARIGEQLLHGVRNMLLFFPVAITWFGVFDASQAWRALTEADPDASESLTFFEGWQDGFGGESWTLGTIALLDALAILALIIVTLVATVYSDWQDSSHAARVAELESMRRVALTDAQVLILSDALPQSSEDLQERMAEGMASLASLESLMESLAAFSSLAEVIEETIPALIGTVDGLRSSVSDSTAASTANVTAMKSLTQQQDRVVSQLSDLTTEQASSSDATRAAAQALSKSISDIVEAQPQMEKLFGSYRALLEGSVTTLTSTTKAASDFATQVTGMASVTDEVVAALGKASSGLLAAAQSLDPSLKLLADLPAQLLHTQEMAAIAVAQLRDAAAGALAVDGPSAGLST